MEKSIIDIMRAGYLEHTINNLIDQIPGLTIFARNPNVKKYFMYTKEEDFVLGHVLGWIMAKCENVLIAFNGGKPIQLDAYIELGNILNNKMPQIREKIFEMG